MGVWYPQNSVTHFPCIIKLKTNNTINKARGIKITKIIDLITLECLNNNFLYCRRPNLLVYCFILKLLSWGALAIFPSIMSAQYKVTFYLLCILQVCLGYDLIKLYCDLFLSGLYTVIYICDVKSENNHNCDNVKTSNNQTVTLQFK